MLQIADGKLKLEQGADIKDAVIQAKEQDKLEVYINKLEIKIKNEKQYNQQVKLMGELRKAKAQLENEYNRTEAN